jgi:hypothetical protein
MIQWRRARADFSRVTCRELFSRSRGFLIRGDPDTSQCALRSGFRRDSFYMLDRGPRSGGALCNPRNTSSDMPSRPVLSGLRL